MTKSLGNVLIRADLNVPITNGKIADNFRIKQALSSIEQIKKKYKRILNNIIFLISFLSRILFR